MASGLAPSLRRLQRKLTLAVWLGRLARQASLVLALAGCAILVARAAFEVESGRALWLLLPLALLPFTAWAGTRARVPSKSGAIAWLDLRSGAAGHLLASHEQGDERWAGALEQQLEGLPELPAMRLGAIARPLLPAIAFAALALLVPLTRADPGASTGFFEGAIAGLERQLQTLTEIAGLDEKLQQELARRVQNLAENMDAQEPEAMLEAIDSLRADLEREGQGAAEVAQELFRRFSHSESQAGVHAAFAQKLFESGLEEMQQRGSSEEWLDKLQALAPELTRSFDGKRFELPRGLQLDPLLMAKLSQLMRDQLRGDLGELDLAGLIRMRDIQLGAGPRGLADLIAKFHTHDEHCKRPGGT